MIGARHILQFATIALLGLATIVVSSAGMAIGSASERDFLSLCWQRHHLYALLAIAAMVMASRFDIRRLQQWRGLASPVIWLVAISFVLMTLTLVPGLGKSVNGASRWLYLGPRHWGISFQPSELVKWAIVLAIAAWCTRRSGIMHRFGGGLIPILTIIATSCFIIMIEDLGTAILVGTVAVCLLLAGGAKIWQLVLLVPPAIMTVAAAILHSPYRAARLGAFLNPWSDPLGSGYHPIQSMLAIAQGGLIGRGLGNGIQKFGYLPEDTTDFIFAIVCEELGVTGAILIIGLYLVLLWAGVAIARNCQDIFSRLFAFGVLLAVGLQAVINIAVVTVLIPTKGIALPLVSAGGTGWVLTATALGLVAGLNNQEHSLQACGTRSNGRRPFDTVGEGATTYDS